MCEPERMESPTTSGSSSLALATIWLQGRLSGLDARPYFLLNQCLWIACGLALYALVLRLSRSRLAAFAAGGSRARAGLGVTRGMGSAKDVHKWWGKAISSCRIRHCLFQQSPLRVGTLTH